MDEAGLWRWVWHAGVSPQLSDRALQALAHGLLDDDPRLRQHIETAPPAAEAGLEGALVGGDPIVYAAWSAGLVRTVGEGEAFFARVCLTAQEVLGEDAVIRYFTAFWDDSERPLARWLLLREVTEILALRQVHAAGGLGRERRSRRGRLPASWVRNRTDLHEAPGHPRLRQQHG